MAGGVRLFHLTCFLFMEVLLLLLMTSWTVDAREEPYVSLAKCRIGCVKEFVTWSKMTDDNACWDTNNNRKSYSMKCFNCWNLCKMFAGSHELMLQACRNRKLCGQGCQQACQYFTTGIPEAAPTLTSEWAFPKGEKVKTNSDEIEMSIKWFAPRPITDTDDENTGVDDVGPGPVVYVLLTRNSNKQQDGWQMIMQVMSTSVRIELDALPLSPEFLLIAIYQGGQLAQLEFKANTIELGEFSDPSGPKYRKLRKEKDAGWYLRTASQINATLSLKTEVVKWIDGSRSKIQRAEVRFRGMDWLATDADRAYYIRWIFLSCEKAYDFTPMCSYPRDSYGATVFTKGNETVVYNIKEPPLNFNSVYQLVIHMAEDYRVKTEIVFKTSPCLQPDKLQLSHCLDEIEEEDLPSVPIKKAREEPPIPQVAQLSVNISSMQLVPIAERTLVQVNFTWTPVANQTLIAYNVTAQKNAGEDKLLISILETPVPYIVLNLEQNQQYTVQVEAFFKQPNITWKSNLLWDSVEFNTSDVNLPMYQGPQAYHVKQGSKRDSVQGIAIGITCVVLSLVLMVLLVILYKKRKSFKDILDTKATVAKSNSYKSNVGGKSDYSNQLIIFADEWELDPLRLKFSHLLGQGAFGKVVTGYFDDQKVAIKLVREGAPISYKEDLVAEINLMKRIGSHPNIVCLIGACTLSEPIALVMEYVPYGNLQNFLKKCRLEGDLQKRCDGPSEITYTVVQSSGSEESGVVTPADMLSFARQVSMAMEYLTEKKYVHRDLAARNVLIDYNKVVKVCDFGLSRDIFNDNHYKKLTNGKLPLKWMAIESLRDRIFTTHSDVWSFGILLWEIVTMGASPYPSVALADLYYVLSNGYRMARPSNCSDKLYSIMRSCWEEDPQDRPSFTMLRLMLEELLSEDRDYLVLEDIDVPISNSDNSSSPSPPMSSSDMASAIRQHIIHTAAGAVGGQTTPLVSKSALSSPDSASMMTYPMSHSVSSMQPLAASSSSSSSSLVRSSLTSSSTIPTMVSGQLPCIPLHHQQRYHSHHNNMNTINNNNNNNINNNYNNTQQSTPALPPPPPPPPSSSTPPSQQQQQQQHYQQPPPPQQKQQQPQKHTQEPAPSSTKPSHHTKSKKASPRRDNLCIKVCIHQKSTDRLLRHSESDSSPSSS